MTIRIHASCQPAVLRFASLALAVLLPAMATFGQSNFHDSDSRQNQYDLINLGLENAPDEVIEPLLEQLGSPDFSIRESASKRLAEIGPAAFAKLSRHYNNHRDYEVRLRIQEIVKDQYLWHTLLRHKGFMGVEYAPYSGAPFDPDQTAILVRRVEPGQAAQEAAMRSGDLIVSVNGQSTNDILDNFAEYIQDQGAGGKLVLGILRKDQSLGSAKTLEITLTLKARPIEHFNSGPLLDELNARMQAYSIWWEKHFSLPRVSRDRLPTSEVLQIPE
jgi:C-terminal processing protease CtpA/Prc